MSLLSLNLRQKLLLAFILLALIPLGVASRSMITITENELKSSVNDQIVQTAAQLANEIDELCQNTWQAPLELIRNAVDNPKLGIQEKVSLLEAGVKNVPDLVSLQLTVSQSTPVVFIAQEVKQRLEQHQLEAALLYFSEEKISALLNGGSQAIGDLTYIPQLDEWLIDIVLELQSQIGGKSATLSGRFSLKRLQERVKSHPFSRTGQIFLMDRQGRQIFDPQQIDLSSKPIVKTAKERIDKGLRLISAEPYVQPSGEKMLGGYAFPQSLDWAILTEKKEEDAYLAVNRMRNQLLIWVAVGFSAAVIVGMVLAGQISKPILEIGHVVKQVGQGNFQIKVNALANKDEIATLGRRINEMIDGLRERFELQKFVSGQTLSAIKKAGFDGIKLGGERRTATVFFSDIRGFTAFSEKVQPEEVIELINTYLSVQARLVKKHFGDIDKFVGDELVAVFQGEQMIENAIRCAVEIQQEIRKINAAHPRWNVNVGIGINSGDMVMGAMGSEDRMDYTILGDNVNLGARLCSSAKAGQTIISENSYQRLQSNVIAGVTLRKLETIQVKGKAEPIQIYEVCANA